MIALSNNRSMVVSFGISPVVIIHEIFLTSLRQSLKIDIDNASHKSRRLSKSTAYSLLYIQISLGDIESLFFYFAFLFYVIPFVFLSYPCRTESASINIIKMLHLFKFKIIHFFYDAKLTDSVVLIDFRITSRKNRHTPNIVISAI